MNDFLQWAVIVVLSAVVVAQQWQINAIRRVLTQDMDNLSRLIDIVKNLSDVVGKVNDRIGRTP